MFLKASCTVVESKAEVWKKNNLLSVQGTGHISGHGLQMSQVVLLAHQHDDDVAVSWSRSSFSQLSTFSYVRCLAVSYTSSASTAPQYYAKLMVQLPLWPVVLSPGS